MKIFGVKFFGGDNFLGENFLGDNFFVKIFAVKMFFERLYCLHSFSCIYTQEKRLLLLKKNRALQKELSENKS